MMSIIRRKLMMAAVLRGGNSDYQKLEYIESSGKQHIDTGVTGGKAAYELIMSIPTNQKSWSMFFAGKKKQDVPKIMYGLRIVIQGKGTSEELTPTTYKGKRLIRYSNGGLYYKDEKMEKNSAFPQCDWGNISFWIANSHEENTLPSKMRVYSLKMWTDDVLVRDYIPVIKDGQVGLLDLVNDKLYTSLTDTPFIAGNPI